jgi:hypothetical protein
LPLGDLKVNDIGLSYLTESTLHKLDMIKEEVHTKISYLIQMVSHMTMQQQQNYILKQNVFKLSGAYFSAAFDYKNYLF